MADLPLSLCQSLAQGRDTRTQLLYLLLLQLHLAGQLHDININFPGNFLNDGGADIGTGGSFTTMIFVFVLDSWS